MNDKVKNILLRVSGISVIGSYIYLRFLKESMPSALTLFYRQDFSIIIKYNCLIFLCFIFTLGVIGSYINIKYILKKPLNIPSNILTKSFIYIYKIIKDSLNAVNKMIADNITDSYTKMKTIILFFYKIFGHKEYLLFFCVVIIPYFIISFSFFCDVYIYFEFNYFYKSLILLFIPLFFHIWLFFIENITINMDEIAKSLIIQHSFLDNGEDQFSFKVKPGYTRKQALLILEKDVPEYLALYPLRGFLESYYNLENKYKPYIMLFFYLIYFIGSLYVFVINLNLLSSL